MLIAPDVKVPSKIALCSLSATVRSTRDLSETVSVWSILLFNVVATWIWVVHHVHVLCA